MERVRAEVIEGGTKPDERLRAIETLARLEAAADLALRRLGLGADPMTREEPAA